MIVVEYTTASSLVLDVQTGGTNTVSASFTSPSFSTTASGLITLCASLNSVSTSWAAGLIGGTTAILRQTSASSTAVASDAGCEDTIPSAAQSAITAAITYGVTGNFAGTVAAFKAGGAAAPLGISKRKKLEAMDPAS